MRGCPYCGRRYDRVSSCDYLDRDPRPEPHPGPLRCIECGVGAGVPHHPYCEAARCQRCRQRFADCGGACEVAA